MKPEKWTPEQYKAHVSKKKNKMNAKGFWKNNVYWHSKKEYMRYLVLLDDLKKGFITDLERQTKFVIVEKNKKERAWTYKADFTYKRDGKYIVEDVKSEYTRKLPAYINTRKMMKKKFNIEIYET